jgi:hypothetical protein
MFKNRYLLTIIALLLVIGAIVPFVIERNRIYVVCKDELSSNPIVSSSSGDLTFKSMTFSSPVAVTVFLNYRKGIAFCHVGRNGSEWDVYNTGFLETWPYP